VDERVRLANTLDNAESAEKRNIIFSLVPIKSPVDDAAPPDWHCVNQKPL
jgi:hypothetical protein